MSRTLVWTAGLAGAVHAGFSLYWALGGRWLLATVGQWAVDLSTEAPLTAGITLGFVAAVKLLGLLGATIPVGVAYARVPLAVAMARYQLGRRAATGGVRRHQHHRGPRGACRSDPARGGL